MLTRQDKLIIRSMLKKEIDFMISFIRRYDMSDDIKSAEIKRLRKLNHVRVRVLNA